MKQRRTKEHLTRNIAKLRKAIRKKYRQFKSGEQELATELEKQYKPIISELKKSDTPTTKIKKERGYFKKEQEEEEEGEADDEDFRPKIFSSPGGGGEKTIVQPAFLNQEDVYGDVSTDEPDISSVLSTADGQETASRYINEKFNHEYTKKYMKLVMGGVVEGRADQIDHVYGPRFDGSVLKIGNALLQFEEDGRIRIGDRTYRGSEGLYELIFMKAPDNAMYDDEDLIAYKDILFRTNAHKKNYSFKGNVNRNSSHKYRLVISDLFPPQQRRQLPYSGTGLVTKSLSAPETVYWDDPNELVDRLRLLVASAEAGNTGVKNEILNILEELREARLITGTGNAAFKSLLK